GGRVFIMPFRVGSGTRLKLIEAFAMGIPVVSTTMGVEGYDVEDNRHLLLADDGRKMAEAVLRLLEQPHLGEHLIANGRLFAREYDWRRVTPKFDEVYHALVA
ncbi:MAG: glycosyltransferase, partial [Candidatus Promineifilaceae bacterium]|nr:glycosyltransferase [Candidatus Promineifilaceae bacterium]